MFGNLIRIRIVVIGTLLCFLCNLFLVVPENAHGVENRNIERSEVNKSCSNNANLSVRALSIKEMKNEAAILSEVAKASVLTVSIREKISEGDFTVLKGLEIENEGGVIQRMQELTVGGKRLYLSRIPAQKKIQAIYLEGNGTENQTRDALGGSIEAKPAGYYTKGCAAYNRACLEKAVKNGCNAGLCTFLAWNTLLWGGCLLSHCWYSAYQCCTKWVDTWVEY